MCWTGKRINKKTAIEDLMVFKVLLKGINKKTGEIIYVSPFILSRYEIGATYESTRIPLVEIPSRQIDSNCSIEIYHGIHCYSKKTKIIMEPYSYGRTMLKVRYYQYTIGPYSTVKLKSFKEYFFTPVIVKCTIPTSTIYYENYMGEIVAERLTLNKEIGIPEFTSTISFEDFYKHVLNNK